MEHFPCTWRIATWRIARSARAMQDYNGDNRFRRPGRPMRHRPHREPSHCHARHRAGFWDNSGVYAAFMHICICAISGAIGGMCGLASHIPNRLAAPAMPPHRNRFTGKGGKPRCIGVVLACICTLEPGAAMYPPPGRSPPYPRHSHTSRHVSGTVPVRS